MFYKRPLQRNTEGPLSDREFLVCEQTPPLHQFSETLPISRTNCILRWLRSQSKTQMVNTQSSSLKVVGQTYLSSADAARSPIAVFDLEMSWYLIKCSAYLLTSSVWTPLNLNIARELKIGFISVLRRHKSQFWLYQNYYLFLKIVSKSLFALSFSHGGNKCPQFWQKMNY